MDIQTLRQQPHLSASSIQNYIECGLQYKFGKIDKIQSEYTSDAMLFGSCIHKALEKLHIAKKDNRELPVERLLELWESEWQKEVKKHPDIRYKEGESFDTLLHQGRKLLTTYFKQRPKDSFKVISTEKPFAFNLEGVPIPIIGVTDLIEEDSAGNIIITDFKTASKAYSSDDIDKSFQLTVYYMAVRKNGLANREILLKFDCLVKTKTPKFQQYYTMRTPEDENRAARKIQQVWQGIEKGVFIPNDTSWKCGYCMYKDHCDKWFQKRQ